MEIIKALKAEQKVLERKLRAIQVSLKTALERFHKEEAKNVSTMKRSKGASKKGGHKIRKIASLKQPSPGRAPAKSMARKAMPLHQKSTAKSVTA